MPRILSVTVVLLILVLYSVTGVSATTLSWTLTVDPAGLEFSEGGVGQVSVKLEGYGRTNYLGYPALPYRLVSVLLPQGEEVSSVRVDVVEMVEVDPSISLLLFEGDYREDGTKVGVGVRGEEVTTPEAVFPRWRVRHVGTSFYRGFRYHMGTGALMLDREVRLVVETELVAVRTDRLERMRYVPGFRESSRREVEGMVINPEMALGYVFDEVEVEGGGMGFSPSYLPSMEGSEVAYLIVTNEEMAPVFQKLADWKTRKGVPAVVRTVEWVGENYRSGADVAESVRNFLQEAYAKWGVEWVLLGGDTDVIPPRFGYVTFYTGGFIPTDMYYSCLDGTWNADGDSLWGEAYHDDADLYAEVYLGRMPVSTYAEAEILVNKTLSYATSMDTLSREKLLILAEVLSPSNWHPDSTIIIDGAEIAESIYVNYLEGNPDIVTSRLYETCLFYPGSICLTRQASLDSMEVGTNHVMHIGHGYKYNMSVGDGSILNYDAYNLTNGDALFSMYLMSCANVAFDTDCLAEYFLLNPSGGAFAVTGNSRSAFPSSSRLYMEAYYDSLFVSDIVHLGKLHVKSREPFTKFTQGETSDRWTHFIYNYLGDPEISMYKSEPLPFEVSTASIPVFGPNDISIHVQSESVPFNSALVCLYKEEDDYAYQSTDGTGTVFFEDFLCRSDGYIYVTVTGLNHYPYIDSIMVLEEANPYLRVSSKIVTDDVIGNDDGILDAGETVVLQVSLENTGLSTAEKLYAILSSSDTVVTITDSTALYLRGVMWGLDGFTFSVEGDVPDERVIEFTFEVHDSTGGYWSEAFAMEVHAPELELYVNAMSDSVPYGNGDGIIEWGEDFILGIGVKNFGTGTAYGLEGKIRALSGNVTVVDSEAVYDDISLLGVEYGDGFVLSESDMSGVNYFTFELTDAHGRTFSKRMELREPGSPQGVVLNATYGPTEIHVTWHPPDSDEAYRYQVYHSLLPGGPYELANKDLVFHTLFRDIGLLASTHYYYVVTTVDSCGNESEWSSEANTTTIPPQLTGWPNMLGMESSSSPKIADIDGDSQPDVVIGAEYIYAWHGNGIELRDGDSKPLTWGVFTTDGGDFSPSSVALAEIDENPGAEIVGASWKTDSIYIFDRDGNTMAGWPKATIYNNKHYHCWASPVVDDFDGDGDMEIIAYSVKGIVYAWHHDGTEVRDGDGNPVTDGVFYVTTPGQSLWSLSTPALADIDEDGIVELVVCAPDDSIYCLNDDGSAVPGWPQEVVQEDADIKASPAVGDIDGDGHQEIVVQNTAAAVYVWNHDGTVLSSWPKWISSNPPYFSASPAIGDLMGDGKLEIVIPDRWGECHILDYLGNPLPNWPQTYDDSDGYTESSPIIADINNDGNLDIILGCEAGIIHAWNIDGDQIPGFPIFLNAYIRGTPVLEDLDLDGDLELIESCWDRNVYVWDLDGNSYWGCKTWNGFHGNIQNTGWNEFIELTSVEEMTFTYRLIGGFIELQWYVAPEITSWNLFRREGEEPFELIGPDLGVDDGGVIRYVDRAIEEGVMYSYKLEASGRPDLVIETEGIEVPVLHARLYQNHPNPFNPTTTVAFAVPGGAEVREYVVVAVYDITGARVAVLVNDALPGGRHEVQWDGRNHRGETVASGVYFARLVVGGFKDTKKMILLR